MHRPSPPVIYYQRLLALDQEEATELVEDYVKAHSPETVYDDVLIPALLLAWQDRQQGPSLERTKPLFSKPRRTL